MKMTAEREQDLVTAKEMVYKFKRGEITHAEVLEQLQPLLSKMDAENKETAKQVAKRMSEKFGKKINPRHANYRIESILRSPELLW